MKVNLTKLNAKGVAHLVVPALILALLVGVVGTYVATKSRSHASTYPYLVRFGSLSGGTKHYAPGNFTISETSNGHTAKAVFNSRGNFVFYLDGTAKWSSGTTDKVNSSGYLELSSSGNINIVDVTSNIYGTQKTLVWSNHQATKASGYGCQSFFVTVGPGRLAEYCGKTQSTSGANWLWQPY